MIPHCDTRAMAASEHVLHPGKPMTRAQQMRKIKKPILEKKRRDRINKSLDDLKDLMMKVYNKDVSDHKLEKADILELTVQYLHLVNSGALGAGGAGSEAAADIFYQYRSGYEQCLAEVSRYLTVGGAATAAASSSGAGTGLQHRLLEHCQERLHAAHTTTYTSPQVPPELMSPAGSHCSGSSSGSTAPPQPQPLPPHTAAATTEHHQLAAQHALLQQHRHHQHQQQLLLAAAAAVAGGSSGSLRDSESPASDLSGPVSADPMWRPWG